MSAWKPTAGPALSDAITDVVIALLARCLFEAPVRSRAIIRFLCSGLLLNVALGRRSNQRFTSGDVKGVPDSTIGMSGRIRRRYAFVNAALVKKCSSQSNQDRRSSPRA